MAQRLLRPMQFVDMLDEMFDLYRNNVLLFAGIGMLAALPIAVIYALFMPDTSKLIGSADPMQMISSLGTLYAIAAGASLIAIIAQGAMTWAVSQCYLQKTPTIIESYRAIRPIIIPLVLTALLVAIAKGIAFVCCVLPVIIPVFVFAFVSQVVVLERKMYFDAMKRSWEILFSDLGRIALNIFLAGLIYYIALLVLQMPVSIMTQIAMLHSDMAALHTAMIASMVLSSLLQCFATPVLTIMFVMIYYDARVRSEGFDLQLLAASLGETTGAPTETPGEQIP